ncbi:MAG: zinc ribbon domain-containing protein [Candidatus Hydrogenedens sp.]|nr:zinc ribbon domain-containing protein [Candidatus Hydrogenedens sp.]
MPTYTYGCKKCGHEFDVFHAISATPELRCESCDSPKVERHLGTGAGIIFKGSGFYETDFKGKKGSKPASESGAKSSESKSSGESCGAGCGCHPPKTESKKKAAGASTN